MVRFLRWLQGFAPGLVFFFFVFAIESIELHLSIRLFKLFLSHKINRNITTGAKSVNGYFRLGEISHSMTAGDPMLKYMLTKSSLPLPSCSSENSLKACGPGERLVEAGDGVHPGAGTYEMHKYIYASVAGFMHVITSKNDEGKEIKRVEVRKATDAKEHVVPFLGAIVTAKILHIGQRFAKVSIFAVENSILGHEFTATLRREDIRSDDKHKIEMHLCFQPSDIILARVIGFGDNQSSFILSTAEDQLGVISSISQHGERMVPVSFTEMKSVSSEEHREPRKVAQIPQLNVKEEETKS
uniref:ECR1_N domain-containing protein n=1 Tax=Steinernema glaseri TaxID=37863 RepID=A0A1I8A942_9BILA